MAFVAELCRLLLPIWFAWWLSRRPKEAPMADGTQMPGGARRRAAHGRAAELGGTVVYEAPASDEVRTAPEGAADPIERRGNGTFTPAGAAAAARRRADLERMPDFAERELDFIPAEAFAPFDEARRELTRATGTFLATTTGGLSCNVWPTVRGACWLTSFGEYWAAVAAQTGDPKAAERAGRFFAMASIERAKADDAAAREATARRDRAPVDTASDIARIHAAERAERERRRALEAGTSAEGSES